MSADNPLPVEGKIALWLAAIAVCIVAMVLNWFIYDAGIKAQLYRECLAMTERVAADRPERIGLPTCYYR